MAGAEQPLRAAIVGTPGSGKTTLAKRVAAKTGAHHVEIDAHFHQPNWTPRDREELRAELTGTLDNAESWVVDGNYESTVGDLVRGRANTIVAFDLPRALIMRRIVMRTIKRAVTREELWNGNREPLTNFYRWDPEKNIIRWAWVKHHPYRERHQELIANGDWDHAQVIVCRSPADADRWFAKLGQR